MPCRINQPAFAPGRGKRCVRYAYSYFTKTEVRNYLDITARRGIRHDGRATGVTSRAAGVEVAFNLKQRRVVSPCRRTEGSTERNPHKLIGAVVEKPLGTPSCEINIVAKSVGSEQPRGRWITESGRCENESAVKHYGASVIYLVPYKD